MKEWLDRKTWRGGELAVICGHDQRGELAVCESTSSAILVYGCTRVRARVMTGRAPRSGGSRSADRRSTRSEHAAGAAQGQPDAGARAAGGVGAGRGQGVIESMRLCASYLRDCCLPSDDLHGSPSISMHLRDCCFPSDDLQADLDRVAYDHASEVREI